MYWPVSRVEFILALLKECGNTNDLPEPEDGDLSYFLHGNGHSGYVESDEGIVMGSYVIYSFGEVPC